MKIQIIANDNETFPCHLCSKQRTKKIIFIEKAPLKLGCCRQSRNLDNFIDFHVLHCSSCGLIQTNARLPHNVYEDVHSEAVGKIWGNHHEKFGQFIIDNLNSKKLEEISILEIGPSINPISRKFPFTKKIVYLDAMPSSPFALEENETFISGIFPSSKLPFHFDICIASHVFEHIGNTNTFLNHMFSTSDMFAISIPNFYYWLEQKFYNAISAEHVIYPLFEQLQYIAQTKNLIFHHDHYNLHSLFTIFKKNTKQVPLHLKPNSIDTKSLIIKWAKKLINDQVIAKTKIPSSSNTLYLTGASHLSQYFLLMNPELQTRVHKILDNSKSKENLRLYGTSAIACSFNELINIEKPNIVVFPSPYSDEIIKQIMRINPSSTVIKF